MSTPHEEGLVHRDIKPANLMLSRKGDKATVKVLDFGLAKVAREEKVKAGLTSEGQALGTPDFIAPEQILSAPNVDIRADIYSLGGTLFYLLTGRPPFQANSLQEVYQAHISRDADSLNLVRPEVPAELAALVARMMAKDPARRFQTPGEVAKALTPFFKKGDAVIKGFQDGPAYSGFSLPGSVSDQQRSPVASADSTGKLASTSPERNRGDAVARRSSAPTELPPQFGRYRVKKKLGGGGMGTVYLVENTELEREEALKVPHFRDGDDPQLHAALSPRGEVGGQAGPRQPVSDLRCGSSGRRLLPDDAVPQGPAAFGLYRYAAAAAQSGRDCRQTGRCARDRARQGSDPSRPQTK